MRRSGTLFSYLHTTYYNLSALLTLLCKLLWLFTKYYQLFRGYMIHNLLLCPAHFALLGNVTIILNRRKLLQEYHITSRYTQSPSVAVNKRKLKYRKKSQLCTRRHFCRKFNSQQPLSEAFFVGCVFLVASSSKYNVFCYSTMYFNHINLSSPLTPLGREGR